MASRSAASAASPMEICGNAVTSLFHSSGKPNVGHFSPAWVTIWEPAVLPPRPDHDDACPHVGYQPSGTLPRLQIMIRSRAHIPITAATFQRSMVFVDGTNLFARLRDADLRLEP